MTIRTPNKLTFFCELGAEDLQNLFADPRVINWLQTLGATVSLGILDHSDERVSVVRQLNENNIPVIAWQLLQIEQGYWYNMANAQQAVADYREFINWTFSHNLHWAGIGVDIEPDIKEIQNLLTHKQQIIPALLKRFFRKKCFDDACKTYYGLVTQMQSDGYSVDSYEFIFMEDDRQAGSCLLGRVLGVSDVPANRRVLMLYSSFFRPYGAAVLCNYACGADSVAVGLTGGGVELHGINPEPLDWNEFSRDLRLARQYCDDIHIFSLEGCVEQGFMEGLINFDWTVPVRQPQPLTFLLMIARVFSRWFLWLTTHPFLTGIVTGYLLSKFF